MVIDDSDVYQRLDVLFYHATTFVFDFCNTRVGGTADAEIKVLSAGTQVYQCFSFTPGLGQRSEYSVACLADCQGLCRVGSFRFIFPQSSSNINVTFFVGAFFFGFFFGGVLLLLLL